MISLRKLASLFSFNGCLGLVYDGKKYKTDIRREGQIIVKTSPFSVKYLNSGSSWIWKKECSLEEIQGDKMGIDDISFQIVKGVLYINDKDVRDYVKK